MPRRRGKGEGHIRRRKDGRWEASLTVGRTKRGNPKRVFLYGKTRQEVAQKLAEVATRYAKGLLVSPENITLRNWAEQWLERRGKDVRPRTIALYRQELAYVLPSLIRPEQEDDLGNLRLQAVQPVHIRTALDQLVERGLSVRTRQKVRQRLHQVFEEALNLELVARNPVSPVKVRQPRDQAPKRVGRTLETHEIAALIAALDQHPDPRTALALRLCLACGLRKGEALGLQWGDLDLEKGTLTVRRTWTHNGKQASISGPKTPTSLRTIPVPHATLLRIKAYLDWWRETFKENPKPEAWLFPGNSGTRPLDLNAPNHALRRIVGRLGLSNLRVHDLRHSFGSLLLSQGAPVELVAERMGHANPNITLGIYRHLLEQERRGWVVDPEDIVRQKAIS